MSSKARGLADLGNAFDDGALSNRNLIINGAMQVAQRGTSTTTQGFATVDRFKATSDGTMVAAVVTQSQDSTGPQGFSNSYKVSVGTSETVAAVDYYYVHQGIEAQNLQQLSFGTSYAKSITLSFWVKSSVTGTYTVSIFRHDAQRIFPKTYTVITANTWEKKVIVVDGDLTGTIANDNGRGIDLYWGLSAGSNYTTGTDGAWAGYVGANFLPNHTADIIGTTNATWQITGVQLEVGDTATPFEHRSYFDQLQSCQRYYERVGSGSSPYLPLGMAWAPNEVRWVQGYTEKRTGPTISTTGSIRVYKSGGGNVLFTSPTTDQISSKSVLLYKTVSGLSATQGDVLQFICGSGVYIELDAEL